MLNTPDRALLESKERDELLQIAAALGVEVAPRARKATIVSAILAPEEHGAFASEQPSDALVNDEVLRSDDPAEPDPAPAVTTRTRSPGPVTSGPVTSGSGPDGSTLQTSPLPRSAEPDDSAAPDDSSAPEAPSDADDSSSEVPIAPEGNRRSRRRGRGREDASIAGETVHCDGLLDLRDEGYGFLRTNGPLPSADDVYVAARQVRQYDLRRGDRVTGVSRPAARSERNPALLRLDTLNGAPPPENPDRPLFDSLTPVLPTEPLLLSGAHPTGLLAAIDTGAPIGMGSRGLLTVKGTRPAAPLLAAMAAALRERHSDIHLIVLLISERPEDVTEMTRRLETSGEVLASGFDRPPEEHLAVAELTLERTKRMAEAGDDVVILFDGLTRLARAYAASGNGRNQPADAVGAAIASALRFFGGARNLEEAGSITMVATARTSTGSANDDLAAARLREVANLEIAFADGLPETSELTAGEIRLDTRRSFSLGEHR